MQRTPTPFSILALAPFSPALDTDDPPIIEVDSQSLDQALEQLAPSLDIPMDGTPCPDNSVAVTIRAMADFRPKNLMRSVPFLSELRQAANLLAKGGSPDDLRAQFPRVAEQVTLPAPRAARPSAKSSAIDDILSMVDTGSDEPATPGNVPAQIDRMAGDILTAIVTNPLFRRMESAWRGAQLLARQAPSGTDTVVRLTLVPLPQGDPEPVLDILGTTLAMLPPDIILFDAPLSNSPHHSAVLERIMDFAEAMLAPVFTPLSPTFFGIETWADLARIGFVPGKLEGAEYGRWKTLAERSGAGWTVPCVGGIMARPRIQTHGVAEHEPLWTSACWALGALCTRSVAVTGRATRFADRSAITLEGLPVTDGATPSPLELPLDTEKLRDFKDAGIIPLAGQPGRDRVFATASVTMDRGPLNFRLFLSRLTGYLIRLAMANHDEITDPEADLTKALRLFIQTLGLPDPTDLTVTAGEAMDGMVPLSISLTPTEEILPGGNRFTFGFGW